MANNPYVNKVEYNGQTLIDLTGLTLTAGDVAEGYTTHNGAGEIITGTAVPGESLAIVNHSRVKLILPTSIASVVGTKLIIQEA